MVIIRRTQSKTIAYKDQERREGTEKESGWWSKYADFTIFPVEELVDG